jgi:hypothetical protein
MMQWFGFRLSVYVAALIMAASLFLLVSYAMTR